MTDEKRLEQERQELNRMIGRGMAIEVDVPIRVKPKGFLGLFRKGTKKVERMRFVVHEPTLSTLDRLSAEQIELRIDEQQMRTEEGVSEAKRMAKQHSRRMARIVAIAVLGQDYVIAEQQGARVKYTYDDRRLNELTDLFFHNVRPSVLFDYVMLISTMSNLGDFTNSIRLMSAARTTMPILVEEGRKA